MLFMNSHEYCCANNTFQGGQNCSHKSLQQIFTTHSWHFQGSEFLSLTESIETVLREWYIYEFTPKILEYIASNLHSEIVPTWHDRHNRHRYCSYTKRFWKFIWHNSLNIMIPNKLNALPVAISKHHLLSCEKKKRKKSLGYVYAVYQTSQDVAVK